MHICIASIFISSPSPIIRKSNISLDKLKLQDDEVQAAKWMTIEEFEKIIDSGNASDTSFDVFKKYYEKFYNTYLVFEDGKPVFKKIEKKN